MVALPVISALGRPKQEDWKSEDTLGPMVSSSPPCATWQATDPKEKEKEMIHFKFNHQKIIKTCICILENPSTGL